MSNIITAGNATNNGTSISSDTSGVLELKTGSTPTTALTINASQNVGIGTASPGANLDVQATTGPQVRIAPVTGTSYGFLSIGNTGGNFNIGRESSGGGSLLTGSTGYASVLNSFGAYPMQFGTNGTLAMTIDSSGNLMVRTTTPYGSVTSATGTGYCFATNSVGNGADHALFTSSGTTVGSITRVGGSNVAYNTSSDYRLKENIAPMVGALDKVSALKPCTYTWKVDGTDGQGFIAHELQAVVPQCVSGEKDAVNEDGSIKPQGIDTSFLVATLTAAIQELKAELDATKAEVAALKGA
jgi:hypothetical protein